MDSIYFIADTTKAYPIYTQIRFMPHATPVTHWYEQPATLLTALAAVLLIAAAFWIRSRGVETVEMPE